MADLLDRDDRRHLLALARDALVARVSGLPAPVAHAGPQRVAGVFVTIRCRGELRGCLGRVSPREPLVDTVAGLAASVADSDPRFESVRADELPDIDIEISVMSPPRPIASIAEIVVGRHGLIVDSGARRGLLLPQVAVEHAWDATTFAGHACLKAGLAADAWRSDAQLSVFEAQVFGERETRGPASGSSN